MEMPILFAWTGFWLGILVHYVICVKFHADNAIPQNDGLPQDERAFNEDLIRQYVRTIKQQDQEISDLIRGLS